MSRLWFRYQSVDPVVYHFTLQRRADSLVAVPQTANSMVDTPVTNVDAVNTRMVAILGKWQMTPWAIRPTWKRTER